MYQRALTEEQFADLWEGMSVAGRSDAGWMMSWTGTHPALGALTIVKDFMCGAIVLSQLPIPDWIFEECGAENTR